MIWKGTSQTETIHVNTNDHMKLYSTSDKFGWRRFNILSVTWRHFLIWWFGFWPILGRQFFCHCFLLEWVARTLPVPLLLDHACTQVHRFSEPYLEDVAQLRETDVSNCVWQWRWHFWTHTLPVPRLLDYVCTHHVCTQVHQMLSPRVLSICHSNVTLVNTHRQVCVSLCMTGHRHLLAVNSLHPWVTPL